MLCKSCGAQIADNSVFCTNCGVRVQPVSEHLQTGSAVQENTATEGGAQSAQPQLASVPDSQEEGAAAGVPGGQKEVIQESIPNGRQEDAAESVSSGQEGSMPNSDQQAGGMWNGQPAGVPNGDQQAGGIWNGQPAGVPNGDQQAGGIWNGQPAGVPNGQQQAGGMWNGQPAGVPNGQQQAGGMWNGQPAGVPNGDQQAGGIWIGQPASVPNGQPQMNGMPYPQPVKPQKKPFVMPAAVNVIFGILAVAAAAVFVCILILGRPEEQKSDLAVSAMAVPAEQRTERISDELNIDLSGVVFELEIPETDAYRAAQELAEGFIFEDSDTRNLTQEDLAAYTDEELWYAYYEIMARAGVDLSEIDDDIHEYFQRKNWYEPDILLSDVLNDMNEEQEERFLEMLNNGEDPSYDILSEAGILNETEIYNMKLIEEYVTYGTVSEEGPEDALEDMLEEQ